MAHLIDKDVLVAEIESKRNDYINSFMTEQVHVLNDVLDFLNTLEVKEVDLEKKSYVKINRKVLFEICDAILNHYGYSDTNDCPESDSECFWNKWDDDFRKKVENIRNNS